MTRGEIRAVRVIDANRGDARVRATVEEHDQRRAVLGQVAQRL